LSFQHYSDIQKKPTVGALCHGIRQKIVGMIKIVAILKENRNGSAPPEIEKGFIF